MEIRNVVAGRAIGSQINTFSLTQSAGSGACHPKIIQQLPIEIGDINPGGHSSVDVPIDFSKCSDNARFSMNLVFSANNGSDVGDIVTNSETP